MCFPMQPATGLLPIATVQFRCNFMLMSSVLSSTST